MIVPAGPMDCNDVLKLRPAEPMRTSRENTCGIQAYLLHYELGYCAYYPLCWAEPFECVKNSNAEGCNQTNAQSANHTTDSNGQACAINGRKH